MARPMRWTFLHQTRLPPNGRDVAIIGAGPSGLAAAGYLAETGYQVNVFDKLPKAGGLMVFGIPAHRIPAERIAEAVDSLTKRYGVRFFLETKICGESPLHSEAGDSFSCDLKSLSDIAATHDAVIICTGTWRSRTMGIPGEDLPGVHTSLEFLFPIRAVGYASDLADVPDPTGKVVAVIGAGHSAIDVAHGALARNAAQVLVLYRRTRCEAPCGTHEIECLEQAGASWVERVVPTRVLGSDRVRGLVLKSRGSSGDQSLELPVDMVVTAIGEIPTVPFARELGLEHIAKGDVRWLQMTAKEGIFVAGDALTGPSKIGKAFYSGLRAARSLHNWLNLKAMNRTVEYDGREDLIEPRELFS
ncbi:FAD-dependent oxidoreductase [Desulfonatronum thioautotrophicum]|uniref:FAD-dependent oxidoreductase n=1 Tax=Desulfonatronum thioautotrophicum TaxID=617001 RepID=UPI0005EB9F47|nr:FAD-dependent oxidoreductase [Desulfonatronum thioautotrophicum]